MKRTTRRWRPRIAIALLLAALMSTIGPGEAAARTRPIFNVTDAPLPVRPGVTMKQIERAIVSAGAVRRWAIRPVRPGELIGVLNIRRHTAEVRITHTRTTFSITYKNSYNLLYSKIGEIEYIHRNYNSWIRNLSGDIVRAVGLIGP